MGNFRFLFPSSESITSPTFKFEYGNIESNALYGDSFLKEEVGGVCVFSLPENLYYLESGARFLVCLPANEEQAKALKLGFDSLDQENDSKTLFQTKHALWEASETTYGKWQKENKDEIPLESFVENRTADGTISYSRFDLPGASFFQWDQDSCEVIFPSRRIGQTKNSWKIISIQFTCPKIEIKETISSKNEQWLRECVQESPNYSESFRHSDSPFGRFLEWSNDTDRIICPNYQSFFFKDSATGKTTHLDSESFLSLKQRHRILLPHSVFLFTSSEQLNGVKVTDSFLLNIGKKGAWFFGSESHEESSFNFKQGEEYFSKSFLRLSCRNQKQFQFSSIPSCLNPGLPNLIKFHSDTLFSSVSNCSVSQIRITEFFSGSNATNAIPSFLELQNFGGECDLSNLVIHFEEDDFYLTAKEKIIKPDELIVISREKWEGWNFQTIQKPLSSKDFKFQIPSLSIKSLEPIEEKKYIQDPNDYILANWNGVINRSFVFTDEGNFFPHPNTDSIDLFSHYGYYLSPGRKTDTIGIPFLDLPISEILLSGTKDSGGSYPERFIEWSDVKNQSGFLSFQIESDRTQRFVLFKDSDSKYPYVKSGMGNCLPPGGMEFPEGSLPNENLTISTLNQEQKPLFFFHYENRIYEILGLSGSPRVSIHPEFSPFRFSYSRASSFQNECSPYSEATPGRQNQKRNQIAANLLYSEKGIPTTGSYSFLEELTSASQFALKSLQRFHQISTPVTQRVLDLVNENIDQIFSKEELIYLDWQDLSESISENVIFRLGEARIEGVYPSPSNSQNEWIYFCNITDQPISTNGYIIEDETSSDLLVPYAIRFPSKIPNFSSGNSIRWNESYLGIGDCAFIVDPDGVDWYLPLFAKNSDILLTVSSTQTIGNGISNLENLDLLKEVNGERLLISTYGKKNTPSSFQVSLKNLEYSLLQRDLLGNKAQEFQIFRDNQ